jgi:hypothetical protein
MDIANCLLNSADRITHESQKADIQTVNSQPVVREASEQMDSPRGSQSVRRKTTRTENSDRTAFLDCHPNSSGRNSTLRPRGAVCCPSGGRHGDISFDSSHRDFGNRTEREISSDQPLNVERETAGNETLNVEQGVESESRASIGENRSVEGMVEWIRGAGRGQRSRTRALSGRIGESHCEAVKDTTDKRRKESSI